MCASLACVCVAIRSARNAPDSISSPPRRARFVPHSLPSARTHLPNGERAQPTHFVQVSAHGAAPLCACASGPGTGRAAHRSAFCVVCTSACHRSTRLERKLSRDACVLTAARAVQPSGGAARATRRTRGKLQLRASHAEDQVKEKSQTLCRCVCARKRSNICAKSAIDRDAFLRSAAAQLKRAPNPLRLCLCRWLRNLPISA